MSQTKRKKETNIMWTHCESIPPHRLLVKCKYCSHWGGVARMKHHLAGTKSRGASFTKRSCTISTTA